jgi:hypothetical protein
MTKKMTEEILVGIIVFFATSLLGLFGNVIYKRYIRDKAFPTRIDALESAMADLADCVNVLVVMNVSQTESIGTLLTASKANLEAWKGNNNGNVTAALQDVDSNITKHHESQSKLSEYIQDRAKITVKRG